MPPKRRAADISRDPSSSEDEETVRPSRRRHVQSSEEEEQEEQNNSDASVNSDLGASQIGPRVHQRALIKKLVRLALATEYSRTPLRRNDITTKIFKDGSGYRAGSSRNFRAIFDGAQAILKDTFGMQLVELPAREKTSLRDRRNATTQTKSTTSTTKNWILTSILPPQLKTNPTIIQPTQAPSVPIESSYTALYTFIISLLYLNNNSLTDQKLIRYLKRVNADAQTPVGNLDKVLQRMQRDGYLDKRRDTVMGEEVVEWYVGPRGKVEVGAKGVAGLVRSVYGHGAVPLSGRPRGAAGEGQSDAPPLVKMEEEELESRLLRSLGVKIDTGRKSQTQQAINVDTNEEDEENDNDAHDRRRNVKTEAGPSRRQTRAGPARARTGRRRRPADDDDSDSI
ncbi:hypothetical protein PV10_08866 [Exophiala mesophila]|uniref:MAGE domain-containing protein n=1 Tax=Exophiala mesophila TaxID=212818 RepID=A0A0D1ZR77_EXOME|nr:uncharacterized protein PV10_08866 [Exophiala mesophila]KIV89288.1 hypothetical protein PV10_08866 [Exophiala mesophila]